MNATISPYRLLWSIRRSTDLSWVMQGRVEVKRLSESRPSVRCIGWKYFRLGRYTLEGSASSRNIVSIFIRFSLKGPMCFRKGVL